jgi:hypothetical protein
MVVVDGEHTQPGKEAFQIVHPCPRTRSTKQPIPDYENFPQQKHIKETKTQQTPKHNPPFLPPPMASIASPPKTASRINPRPATRGVASSRWRERERESNAAKGRRGTTALGLGKNGRFDQERDAKMECIQPGLEISIPLLIPAFHCGVPCIRSVLLALITGFVTCVPARRSLRFHPCLGNYRVHHFGFGYFQPCLTELLRFLCLLLFGNIFYFQIRVSFPCMQRPRPEA